MIFLIIDIDDTIAHCPKVNTVPEFQALDHKKFKPKKDVLKYVQNRLKNNTNEFPIFLTARCETLKESTLFWLKKHLDLEEGKYRLEMRPYGNFDPSSVLKINYLIDRNIQPEQINLWIDDDKNILLEGNLAGYNVVHPDIIEEIMNEEYWQNEEDY